LHVGERGRFLSKLRLRYSHAPLKYYIESNV